jgi:hypothetical protein
MTAVTAINVPVDSCSCFFFPAALQQWIHCLDAPNACWYLLMARELAIFISDSALCHSHARPRLCSPVLDAADAYRRVPEAQCFHFSQ